MTDFSNYKIWPFEPESNVIEKLAWLTDILTSLDGSEQRIKIRHEPRQAINASFILEDGVETSKARIFMESWQSKLWLLPLWIEASVLENEVVSGANQIYFNTTLAFYAEGEKIILWESNEKYEILTIQTVNSDSLVFTSNTINSYNALCVIMPTRFSKVLTEATRQDYINSLTEYAIEFTSVYNRNLDTIFEVETLDDIDLFSEFLTTSDFKIERKIKRPFDSIDTQTSSFETNAVVEFSDIVYNLHFSFKDREKAFIFKKWLYKRSGKCVPFWLPSWKDDLIFHSIPISTDASIQIKNCNFTDLGFEENALNKIAIFDSNGSFVYKTISNAVETSIVYETLTLDSQLGISNAVRISFLNLVRLNVDSVEIVYKNGETTCDISAKVIMI